jgi:hypothetical protein
VRGQSWRSVLEQCHRYQSVLHLEAVGSLVLTPSGHVKFTFSGPSLRRNLCVMAMLCIAHGTAVHHAQRCHQGQIGINDWQRIVLSDWTKLPEA